MQIIILIQVPRNGDFIQASNFHKFHLFKTSGFKKPLEWNRPKNTSNKMFDWSNCKKSHGPIRAANPCSAYFGEFLILGGWFQDFLFGSRKTHVFLLISSKTFLMTFFLQKSKLLGGGGWRSNIGVMYPAIPPGFAALGSMIVFTKKFWLYPCPFVGTQPKDGNHCINKESL